MNSTTSEVTFRAVFRHAEDMGSTYRIVRDTADEAWADVDGALAAGHDFPGEWVVQQTTTTTTTKDLPRR